MATTKQASPRRAPSGVAGFDEITEGGLPAGKVSLVLGSAGSGKTIFSLQMLVSGARQFGEPGVFVAFEESAKQVFENTAGFGWDAAALVPKRLAVVDAQLSQ